MQNGSAVCLNTCCVWRVVHHWQRAVTLSSAGWFQSRAAWGQLAALPAGATEVLAGLMPLCLSAWLGIAEPGAWAVGFLQYTDALRWAVGSGHPSVHGLTAVGSGQWGSFSTRPHCRGHWAVGIPQYSAALHRTVRSAASCLEKHAFDPFLVPQRPIFKAFWFFRRAKPCQTTTG